MQSFFNSPIYGDLTKMVQITFNEASKKKVTLFGQTYIDRFFDFKNPQSKLTVSELMGTYKIRVMAALIGDKGLTPVRSNTGADTFIHKIPRFGHKVILTVDELRDLQDMMETQSRSSDAGIKAMFDENKKNELLKTMMNTVQDTVLGTKDALDYFFLSALFNEGVAEYNAFNNPEGIPFIANFEMKDENKLKVAVGEEWTVDNLKNGTVDPIDYLIDLIQKYSTTLTFDRILCSPKMRYSILRSKSLRLAVRGNDMAATPIREDELDSALKSLGIPPIEAVYKQNGILKDGKPSTITPINDDTLVLIPAGKLGVVRSAFEDNQIIEEDNVSYSTMTNGIRVAQWKVGESTGQDAGEYTQASVRALPIIKAINAIVSVKVNNVAVVDDEIVA